LTTKKFPCAGIEFGRIPKKILSKHNNYPKFLAKDI